MKILNLYSGIGGNRKLWTPNGDEHEITAVELNPEIAKIYQDFFPNDTVIVGDAHQYLIEHYKEFDFIWTSPPCPTHSRFNFLADVQEGKSVKFADMKLYEEIILLKTFFKGLYCVENVISYYKPLIAPTESGSHYYWTNFYFKSIKNVKRTIRRTDDNHAEIYDRLGFDLTRYKMKRFDERQCLNNCVEPSHGKYILDAATGFEEPTQEGLFAE